jgi:hypothetical protein
MAVALNSLKSVAVIEAASYWVEVRLSAMIDAFFILF